MNDFDATIPSTLFSEGYDLEPLKTKKSHPIFKIILIGILIALTVFIFKR